MNRFTHYTQSQFTPLTSQEILQPVLLMRDKHDKIEEQYTNMSDEASQMAYIAEGADPNSQMAKD